MLKYGERKGGFMKYLNKILFGFLLVISINKMVHGQEYPLLKVEHINV